jgi:hypothetical protein
MIENKEQLEDVGKPYFRQDHCNAFVRCRCEHPPHLHDGKGCLSADCDCKGRWV